MTEMKKSNSARNPYFDFLRGIAIVMVVAIHSFGEIYEYEALSFLALLLRQFMNAAVPIFCASSAYFLIEKNIHRNNYFDFLKKHILRVYIPLLFFSFPYFVNDIVDGKNSLVALIKLFTCSYSVYYFIAVIIQFYLVVPLFQKYTIFRNKMVGFLISFVWVFAYCYIVREAIELPSIVYGGLIFCFWTYFSIGASVSKNTKLAKKQLLLVIILVALAMSIAESYFIMNKTQSLEGSGLKPSAVLFSSALVTLLYSLDFSQKYHQNKISKIFETLGQFSLGIYLSHLFVQTVLLRMPPPRFYQDIDVSPIFLWILLTVCIVLISFFFLWIAKKISPRLSRMFLGV